MSNVLSDDFRDIEHAVSAGLYGRKSAWAFKTSGTAGIGLGYVAISGGDIQFLDPHHAVHKVWYGGVGAGLSVGVSKILSKLANTLPFARLASAMRTIHAKDITDTASGAVAPESFPNHGLVYALAGCQGSDLDTADLRGLCIYLDLSASLFVGYGGQAILINCNPQALAMLDGGLLGEIAFLSVLGPHALLLSWGPSLGLQANIGGACSAGWMHAA